MVSSALLGLIWLVLITFVGAQSSIASGYVGYSMTTEGDPNSAVYETDDTSANVSTTIPPPDVYLNASVHVGEIDITVSNLTAQINLQAQVLQLLSFNAGIDLSIDRVFLTIQNVTAKVLLEARLSNLLLMISDVLDSLDLNPVLATLGNDVGQIVNETVGGLSGVTSSVSRRSLELQENILYSVNDYSGNTHTNRILEQDGSIVDQKLNNDGNVQSQSMVGSYLRDMTFNGYNTTAVHDNRVVQELEYVYAPFNGLSVVSAVYINSTGNVVGTQVLSGSSAGGTSTISDL